MVSIMRVLILCLSACIVSPANDDETGIEPDVDVDGDSDSDSDGDGDSDSDTDLSEPWTAEAISFDFSGAIIGGEIVDGAILSGKRHDASFGISLMATGDSDLQDCNVHYAVAGAPSAVHAKTFDGYWRSWDFSGFAIDEMSGDCESMESIFYDYGYDVVKYGSLEQLLAAFTIHMGLEDITNVDPGIENEWREHWGFGDWDEDLPYLAAGGLFLQPFHVTWEMNVFQGYEMDTKTMEVEGDGFDLVPIPLKGALDVPDGFYTSSPMFVIGTRL
jgi:hypothetical protein